MMYICCFCGGFIKDDGKGILDGGSSNISHGLCGNCEKLTDAERDKLADAKTKKREEDKNEKSKMQRP